MLNMSYNFLVDILSKKKKKSDLYYFLYKIVLLHSINKYFKSRIVSKVKLGFKITFSSGFFDIFYTLKEKLLWY